ncbi:ATP-grasp fold amidoligase family protein [Shewanella algae]|uniref:ATP-grasp fold amidoligase family protein n=1 Tax=Shewanella algae TaxID=38313 RepID=UPI001AAE6548|nr:ATP-grasp fold amidoligase family protein [Shewanella algae]MBO2590371.1 hypothetical protein [Shewanella algae]
MLKSIFCILAPKIPESKFILSLFLKVRFKSRMRESLNLRKPQTLNEKLQWIKLYDRNPLYTKVADKLHVREYVEKHGLAHILIPCILSNDEVDTFDLKKIGSEQYPIIVKVNHDCSGGLIIRDPKKPLINVKNISVPRFNIDSFSTVEEYNNAYVKHFIKERFKYNHYFSSIEWQYKNIKPCYLVETLLVDDAGKIPNDYKFHCFNGKVEFVYVSVDREGGDYRKIYYPTWVEAEFTWTKLGKESVFGGEGIPKPNNLEEMISISEKLASQFKYVRVDLYSVDGKVFFGELTLQHGSGFEPILPKEFDLKYGTMLNRGENVFK